MASKEILITCIAFRPNIGGVETHLNDLVGYLTQKNIYCHVLTYQPITADTTALGIEIGKYYTIYRINWFGNLFYKLVHNPILEFVYLTPGLFVALPILLLTRCRNVKTIHSHGLVAGFVSVFWGKLFGKTVITTTHSIYNFPKLGLYRSFSKWLFSVSNHVLCLSQQSVNEIVSLGIDVNKVTKFTYWIDLKKFVPAKLNKRNFIVLFVGRMVPEKGLTELVAASKIWNKKIKLQAIGDGPLKSIIPSDQYLGKISQDDLPKYYQNASLTIVPSTSEEGFGRVILESLACGIPVVGSRRGAISEALDASVGVLIDVTPETIKTQVEYFYEHPKSLDKLGKNARSYAEEHYAENNADLIVKYYV